MGDIAVLMYTPKRAVTVGKAREHDASGVEQAGDMAKVCDQRLFVPMLEYVESDDDIETLNTRDQRIQRWRQGDKAFFASAAKHRFVDLGAGDQRSLRFGPGQK